MVVNNEYFLPSSWRGMIIKEGMDTNIDHLKKKKELEEFLIKQGSEKVHPTKKRVSHLHKNSSPSNFFGNNFNFEKEWDIPSMPATSISRGSILTSKKTTALMQKAKLQCSAMRNNIASASNKRCHLNSGNLSPEATNSAASEPMSTHHKAKNNNAVAKKPVVKKKRNTKPKEDVVKPRKKGRATKNTGAKVSKKGPLASSPVSDQKKKIEIMRNYKIPKIARKEEKVKSPPKYNLKRCSVQITRIDVAMRKYKRIRVSSSSEEEEETEISENCQLPLDIPTSLHLPLKNSIPSSQSISSTDIPSENESTIPAIERVKSQLNEALGSFKMAASEISTNSISQDKNLSRIQDLPSETFSNPESPPDFSLPPPDIDSDDEVMIINEVSKPVPQPVPIPPNEVQDDDEVTCIGEVKASCKDTRQVTTSLSAKPKSPPIASQTSSSIPNRLGQLPPVFEACAETHNHLDIAKEVKKGSDLSFLRERLQTILSSSDDAEERKKSLLKMTLPMPHNRTSSSSSRLPSDPGPSTSSSNPNVGRPGNRCISCWRNTISFCSTCMMACCYNSLCAEKHRPSCKASKNKH